MRVLVGMSGGVDSSYTAMKLMSLGHEVEGAVVIMHECSDVEGARAACDKIGIKLNVIDAREPFESIVKTNFVNEYANARTPNPCIICNPKVKFRALYEYAKEHGFDKIATGHYAKILEREKDGAIVPCIAKSLDTGKDQSYMLYRLPAEIISDLILPLGDMTKDAVKEELARLDMSDLIKKDSQEICFLPDGDYPSYIESVKGVFPCGDFLDTDGNVLGKHSGIIRYTVGQRKGLGVSSSSRLFIKDIDPLSNSIVLSCESPVRSEFIIEDAVFAFEANSVSMDKYYTVKVRYQAKPERCRVEVISDIKARIYLENPVKSVAPGQSAVIYDGDIVIGGGFISFA